MQSLMPINAAVRHGAGPLMIFSGRGQGFGALRLGREHWRHELHAATL